MLLLTPHDPTHVTIEAIPRRPLTWREVWECFAAHYPGRWAVQAFPPADRLLDQTDRYHLLILKAPVEGLDIW